MKKYELTVPMSEDMGAQISRVELPESIPSKITEISNLEKEINESEKSAKDAMNYVNNKMQKYKEKGIGIFKHRSGNTKDIVEDTQDAVEKLAKAQQVSVTALKKSFEFQKRLAEFSKYLFDLGCMNIANNRSVVRQIEAELNGASKEQISEIARQELMNVLRQLKQQEDILKKQEFLTSKVKENVFRLDEKDLLDKEQSEAIQKNTEDIKRLEDIPQKLEENVSRLDEKDLLDKEQSEAIQKNAEDIKRLEGIPQKLEENVSRLNEKDLLDKKQSETIQRNSEDIQHIFEYIEQNKTTTNGLVLRSFLNALGLIAVSIALMKSSNKICSIIAICAALLSLLSFVIDFVKNIINIPRRKHRGMNPFARIKKTKNDKKLL